MHKIGDEKNMNYNYKDFLNPFVAILIFMKTFDSCSLMRSLNELLT